MNERRQPLTLPLIALLVAVFAAPACASMQQRVTESENRSNTLEAQVADLQANQQNIISRLAALRATLEDALDPIRAQQAGGGADLRALEAQVATLSEQVRQLTTALAVAQAAAATTPTTEAPTLTTPMPAAGGGLGQPVLTLVLTPPREPLYAACDARFAAMIEAGAVAEVRALAALGLNPAAPVMKALGVRQLRRHLAGETSLAQAIAAAQQATRNYAKRQATWFRHQIGDAVVYDRPYSPELARDVIEEIRLFLLTE